MKLSTFLVFSLTILSNFVNIHTIPTISPKPQNCDNGISCTSSQTCMSNATGAGIVYACSPLTNAVRCIDARFSCPYQSICSDNSTCTFSDGSVINAVVNVDAFEVSEIRDFGSGMKLTSLSVCGPITNIFRLPNFCTCRDTRFGSELNCVIGLQTFLTIGASAWIMPCASPANLGYRAWVSIPGVITSSIGNTWVVTFTINQPIPGASLEIGFSRAGARAELTGEINRFVISTRLAIGVCGSIGVGPFSKEICNPSILRWLPVTVINGPRHDFSRFC